MTQMSDKERMDDVIAQLKRLALELDIKIILPKAPPMSRRPDEPVVSDIIFIDYVGLLRPNIAERTA